MTVHIGWVIAAALAGFMVGAILMSMMAVGADADERAERIFENTKEERC